MKTFKNIVLICGVIFCSMLLTATACNTTKGIVESYKIEEQYIKIQFNEQKDLYCYPSVFIYSSYFEKYSCNNLDELLNNEEFSSGLRSDWTLLSKSGEALAPSAYLNIENDKCLYLLVYEGSALDEGFSLPDSFHDIKDASNYIGYIKF
ncbi:MAG: hypothetical protein K2L42_06625 [Clostridia bacterium]|nr:hypothetical protein [Clostridia bacterium]